MKPGFAAAADAVLRATVDSADGVPGVVALLTDRVGTLYAGTAGLRSLDSPRAMTTDTVVALFSCTKAVTATAFMQLVQDGKVALDEPARTYVPEIAAVRVLDGFADGEPRLRPPASDITLEQLLLHTAGFGYDMFDAGLVRFNRARKIAPNDRIRSLMSVLTADPGRRWEYGVSIDWLGKVVEAVRGQPLGAVMRHSIFEPLAMSDSGYTLTPGMRERRAAIHERTSAGTLTAKPNLEPPAAVTDQLGGSGLHATPADYLAFIRMILCDGAAPDGTPILKPATVAQMTTNHLAPHRVRALPAALPQLSHPLELFAGTPQSWGYSWMINDETAPTGRPAGSCGWAGLANLYYWIDRRNGIAGFWCTQILPFLDPASLRGFFAFEKTVYDHVQ